MSFLTTNYAGLEVQNNDFGPLPKGKYEMVIKSADLKSSKAGQEYINVTFVVRNDLDNVPNLKYFNGKYRNRYVFAAIFTDKETNQYKQEDLMYYLQAARVPEGTQIADMQQFLDLLAGKPVLAYVSQREITYNGETSVQNNVWANAIEPSNFPQLNHVWASKEKPADPFSNATTNSGQPINNDNLADNLPF